MSSRSPLRERLWACAGEAPGLDPAIWRIDHQGRLISWWDFGNERSAFGWTSAPIRDDDDSVGFAAVNLTTLKEMRAARS